MMILDVMINHTEKLRNLDFVTCILISNVWFKHVCIFFFRPQNLGIFEFALVRPGL